LNINGDSARVVLEVVHTDSTALVPTISEYEKYPGSSPALVMCYRPRTVAAKKL
jgi:hypothetical protein